jgi:hypothetical protein
MSPPPCLSRHLLLGKSAATRARRDAVQAASVVDRSLQQAQCRAPATRARISRCRPSAEWPLAACRDRAWPGMRAASPAAATAPGPARLIAEPVAQAGKRRRGCPDRRTKDQAREDRGRSGANAPAITRGSRSPCRAPGTGPEGTRRITLDVSETVAEREELYSNVLSQICERPRANSLPDRYFIEGLCLTYCCLRSFL